MLDHMLEQIGKSGVLDPPLFAFSDGARFLFGLFGDELSTPQ